MMKMKMMMMIMVIIIIYEDVTPPRSVAGLARVSFLLNLSSVRFYDYFIHR